MISIFKNTDKIASNIILFIKINIENVKKSNLKSYKVNNKSVYNCWKNLSYILTGESLTNKPKIQQTVNGITISPKKNFCIIKIWLSTCEYQDPSVVLKIKDLSSEGCLFKRHNPEF